MEKIEENLPKLLDEVIRIKAAGFRQAFTSAGEDPVEYGEEVITEFLHDYLQISFVVFTEDETKENGIAKTLSDTLDTLELSKRSRVEQKYSYMRQLISGKRDDSNAYLRNHPTFSRLAADERFPLNYIDGKSVHIRDLGKIASGYGLSDRKDNVDKTSSYIAVVQCDGDNMGRTIAAEDEHGNPQAEKVRLRNFSYMCMAYTSEASKMVTDYGGVVIYAGGDDLLFIAPVQATRKSKKYSNIWELCRAIGEKFGAIFEKPDVEQKPTLSVGVSIQYHKFPLYESFNDASGCLFGEAKNFIHGTEKSKNNIAMHLQKHSGQFVGFTMCMETHASGEPIGLFDAFIDILQDFYGQDNEDMHSQNNIMHSVIYNLEEQHVLIQEAMDTCDKQVISNVIDNSFDNFGQKFGDRLLTQIKDLEYKLQLAYKGGAVKGNEQKSDSADILVSMLRMAKFLVEED